MRGDSLRDFYAKTLAVLGLGLLAGAGAMVDYWPTGSGVPLVDAVKLPAPEVPALTQKLDQQIPLPVSAPRPVYARGTILAKNVGTARFLPAVVETPRAQAMAPTAEPVPELSAPVADTTWNLVAPKFVLASHWDAPRGDTFFIKPAASAPAPSFIGGALKKTKDSIVRTGAATGATIADAVKGVFGAFKKVSPF